MSLINIQHQNDIQVDLHTAFHQDIYFITAHESLGLSHGDVEPSGVILAERISKGLHELIE